MTKVPIIVGAMLILAAGGVQAHAHLKASTPKEGEAVTEMPASIALTFSESARVTAVWIQKDQEPKQKLTAPTTAGEQINVAVPVLAAGAYTLSWRVASTDDNYIMSGDLHFTGASTNINMPMKH